MNTMTHKGYTARVEYDERDSIFVGRVLGIRTIISFHGKTVDKLRKELKTAVDDYIADCESQGVHPEKPAVATARRTITQTSTDPAVPG
jgi:predicted HicB family RNase H-like nuclease